MAKDALGVSRFTKMSILWYVIGKEIFNLDTDLAKSYGVAKATQYAIYKNRGRCITVKSNKNHNEITKTSASELLELPNGDAFKLSYPCIIVANKKISPHDFDKQIAKLPVYILKQYVAYAKTLIQNYTDPLFYKSKWYNTIWKPNRDLTWVFKNS